MFYEYISYYVSECSLSSRMIAPVVVMETLLDKRRSDVASSTTDDVRPSFVAIF